MRVFRTDTPGGGLIAENGSDLLDITKTLADYDVSDFINYTQNTSTAQADNGLEDLRLMGIQPCSGKQLWEPTWSSKSSQ